MEFLDKLDLAAPGDISARMPLVDSQGKVLQCTDGEEGWIEFWGPEAEATRQYRRKVQVEQLLQDRRRAEKGKKTTRQDAERQLDELDALLIEGVSQRVKAWRLVSADGEVIDVEADFAAAKKLFGASGYEFLRNEAVQFLADPENFTNTKRDNS